MKILAIAALAFVAISAQAFAETPFPSQLFFPFFGSIPPRVDGVVFLDLSDLKHIKGSIRKYSYRSNRLISTNQIAGHSTSRIKIKDNTAIVTLSLFARPDARIEATFYYYPVTIPTHLYKVFYRMHGTISDPSLLSQKRRMFTIGTSYLNNP